MAQHREISFFENINIDTSLELNKKKVKLIKVEPLVWGSLKALKKENETFTDVIRELLNERTKTLGNDNFSITRYSKKTDFFEVKYSNNELIGFEYEYNDIKSNKSDFVIDIIIKKIYYKSRSYTPSEFYGVDNDHKHFSPFFMTNYLNLILVILAREYRVSVATNLSFDIHMLSLWRKAYHEYGLSYESFKSDIENPLKLSLDEKPDPEWQSSMRKSVIMKYIDEILSDNKK